MLKYKLLFFSLLNIFCISANSQFHTDTTRNIKKVIHTFLNSANDIKTGNIKYYGNKNSIGFFGTHCSLFPIQKGIILSTGDIWDAAGPNKTSSSGNNHYFPGDKELETLANGKTFDAAILEFDFSANSDSMSFDYVFASEEYPEYVNKGLNDVFAFFISNPAENTKQNIALCNNLPVTVNNINAASNKTLFVSNNQNNFNCLSYSLQFDGLTVKLSSGLKLKPYNSYRFKIAIADVGDGLYDSAVMLRANSFSSCGKLDLPAVLKEVAENLKDQSQFVKVDSAGIEMIPNFLFDFNSSDLNDTSKIVLERLSNVLNRYFDFDIEISGYADNIGSAQYNESLSLKRAQAIENFLIGKNVKATRMLAKGFGAANPLANNSTEEGRQKNRRVTIRMYKRE